MGERHSDQYGCTKLLFIHATLDLSKALLGASRNRNCLVCQLRLLAGLLVCQLRFTHRGVHASLRGYPRVAPC